jgi:hypothetical protein
VVEWRSWRFGLRAQGRATKSRSPESLDLSKGRLLTTREGRRRAPANGFEYRARLVWRGALVFGPGDEPDAAGDAAITRQLVSFDLNIDRRRFQSDVFLRVRISRKIRPLEVCLTVWRRRAEGEGLYGAQP